MMKTKYDDMRKGQLINIIITQNEIMENQRELIETLYEFREVTLDRLLRTKGNDLAGKDYGQAGTLYNPPNRGAKHEK